MARAVLSCGVLLLAAAGQASAPSADPSSAPLPSAAPAAVIAVGAAPTAFSSKATSPSSSQAFATPPVTPLTGRKQDPDADVAVAAVAATGAAAATCEMAADCCSGFEDGSGEAMPEDTPGEEAYAPREERAKKGQ